MREFLEMVVGIPLVIMLGLLAVAGFCGVIVGSIYAGFGLVYLIYNWFGWMEGPLAFFMMPGITLTIVFEIVGLASLLGFFRAISDLLEGFLN